MNTTKISNIRVRPVVTDQVDPSRIGGYSVLPACPKLQPCNTVIAGITGSGKTSVIATILEKCIGKKTKVIFFVSSINSDDTYRHIVKNLKKRGIEYEKFLDLNHEEEDEDGNAGRPYNALDELRIELQKKYPDVDEEEDEEEFKKEELEQSRHSHLNFGEKEKLKEIQAKNREKKKPKKIWPDYMVVFDDLGEACRHPSVGRFITKSRHFLTKTIFATHSLKDLMPRSIAQTQFILLFGGYNMEEMKELYDKLSFPLPFMEFWKAYNFATSEKYHFFFIDKLHNQLRRDFDTMINI